MKDRRTAPAAVVAALALGVSACSGPASGGATQTPTDGESASGAPTSSYAHLSDKQVHDALLTYRDLPPGYSEAPDSASARDHTFCSYRQPTKAVVKGTRSFDKGGGVSQQFVSVSIREYATPASAKKAWDALQKTLSTCHQETYQGERLTYSPMSAPEVGDDSVGVRMTVTDPTVGDMTLVQYFALVGPALVSSGGGGLMTVDADLAAHLLDQQVAAYQDAALG